MLFSQKIQGSSYLRAQEQAHSRHYKALAQIITNSSSIIIKKSFIESPKPTQRVETLRQFFKDPKQNPVSFVRFSAPKRFLSYSKTDSTPRKKHLDQKTIDLHQKALKSIETRKPNSIAPGYTQPSFFIRSKKRSLSEKSKDKSIHADSDLHKKLKESIYQKTTASSYGQKRFVEDYNRQKQYPLQLFATRKRNTVNNEFKDFAKFRKELSIDRKEESQPIVIKVYRL